MPDSAQTPELALRYLEELSTDIRASLILDRQGALAAANGLNGAADGARERVLALFERAGDGAAQVEVRTTDGGVFAVREQGWTIAAVTGRFALPSLVFYDLRTVLGDLERRKAA